MAKKSSGESSSVTKFQKFKSETIPRSRLKNAPYNPSRATKTQLDKLRDGIKRFGFVGGIVWNARTENIVGGHKRLSQLDALNGSPDYQLTVDVVDISEADEIALNVLLNNREAQGNFDIDLLSEAMSMLSEHGGNPTDTGFSTVDLQAILGNEFLDGVFAEQAEAEGEVISELESIRNDAKASRKESTPERKADLKKKREKYREQVGDDIESDADFCITLVFDSNESLGDFLHAAKLPSDKRYFDGHEFCRTVGLTIDE